ncbi:MAG TPA: hypothetical protein VFA18_19145 [Gemmataceae bacterium]|nr:hypothetical protein [Gemmataceae bacterium]
MRGAVHECCAVHHATHHANPVGVMGHERKCLSFRGVTASQAPITP